MVEFDPKVHDHYWYLGACRRIEALLDAEVDASQDHPAASEIYQLADLIAAYEDHVDPWPGDKRYEA